jgi:hypothetical protein
MGTVTDYTLPGVRWSLGENQRLLVAHLQTCEPCRTRKPSKSAWCPYGWQLAGAQRQLQAMVRRMEAIQLEERQSSLFDEPAAPLVPFVSEREEVRNPSTTTGAAQLAGTATPAQIRTLERNRS